MLLKRTIFVKCIQNVIQHSSLKSNPRRVLTWLLTLRKEYRLKMFKNWVLQAIFGPKRKWYKGGDSYIMRDFVISTCAPNMSLI